MVTGSMNSFHQPDSLKCLGLSQLPNRSLTKFKNWHKHFCLSGQRNDLSTFAFVLIYDDARDHTTHANAAAMGFTSSMEMAR